jgi:hypothetical protein
MNAPDGHDLARTPFARWISAVQAPSAPRQPARNPRLQARTHRAHRTVHSAPRHPQSNHRHEAVAPSGYLTATITA